VSAPAFTPGPWHADFGEVFRIREADGSSVAYTQFVHLKGRRDSEEVTANACLIAAAPELYASLIELLEPLERASAELVAHGKALDQNGEAAFDRARAALAKARGGQ
jgi:hypothetical protein